VTQPQTITDQALSLTLETLVVMPLTNRSSFVMVHTLVTDKCIMCRES